MKENWQNLKVSLRTLLCLYGRRYRSPKLISLYLLTEKAVGKIGSQGEKSLPNLLLPPKGRRRTNFYDPKLLCQYDIGQLNSLEEEEEGKQVVDDDHPN